MWVKITLIFMFGCSGSLTSTFDIRGIVNGDRMASVPLGISLGAGQIDVEGICSAPGMACQNCSLAVTCIPLPAGWLKLPLEECGEGYTCNAHLGKCAKEPVPECDARSLDYTHSCEQVGIFPDAYDCRKFHLCSPPESLPDGRPADHRTALCPRHYGYNPQNAQCSIPLTHGQCNEKLVPECKTAGEYGELASSPNYYYVCLSKQNSKFKIQGVLRPQIFICPNGWFFWDGFCRPNPKPVTLVQNFPTLPNVTPVSPENSSEEAEKTTEPILDVITEPTKEETATSMSSFINSFFSTDKPVTNPVDTFLADKFDLMNNYETIDDPAPNSNDYNSYGFDPDNGDWNHFD